MTQVIFQNNETLMQHLYRPGFMFQHLPRIGEEISLYGDDDDEIILDGIVQNVRWGIDRAMETANDYSVFICVDPFPPDTVAGDGAGVQTGDMDVKPAPVQAEPR